MRRQCRGLTVLLSELIQVPGRVGELSEADWDVLIPQARISSLLAALKVEFQRAACETQVPPQVMLHLDASWAVYLKQQQNLRYEVLRLQEALDELGLPLILLKGAAYAMAGLPLAEGRLISDVDILVPKQRLTEVEEVLHRHGWSPGDIHPYNNRYYREWMHELPPMEHVERHSTVDVHHTILPPTTASQIDADGLWQDRVEVAPGVAVLSPVDQVIHSAVHLFHEGEFGHGLRDLRDLDQLLRIYLARRGPTLFDDLLSRASDMAVEVALFYALRYSSWYLGTPVPGAVLQRLHTQLPGRWRQCLVDALFRRAFRPRHSSSKLAFNETALFLLYVRAHYLRMPLRYLIPHLARKAWMAWMDSGLGSGRD